MNNATTIVIIVLALGWILYRQMQVRPVKENALRLPVILGAIGLVQTVQYVANGGAIGIGNVAAAILGLTVAIALAYPRARTTKVFPGPDGSYLRQGTAATIALWIIAIGAHIAIDVLVPMGFGDRSGHGLTGATMMLYIGVTLFAQSWFLRQRITAHRNSTAAPRTVGAS